jgi:hypothetical protein
VLTLLRARGDDEPLGDVAQAPLLLAQVEGHGQHVLVGDARAADGLAALAGGLVAFEGAVADVLAPHPGHGRKHGEHDFGRVVRALQFAGEELQAEERSERGV